MPNTPDPGSGFTAYLAAGGGSPTAAFPGTSTSAQDAYLYGISPRLAIMPVTVSATGGPLQPVPTPPGWHAPMAAPQGPPSRGPVTMTVEQAYDQLFTLSLSDFQALQRNMYQAGLFPRSYYGRSPTPIVPDISDSGTISAWHRAVDLAAQSGRPVDGLIAAAVSDRAKGGQGALEQPLPVHVDLSSPDDLALVFQQTAQKMIGQKLSDTQIQGMIAAYQQLQTTAQTSAQTDSQTQSGGTTVSAPPPDAYAAAQLNQNQGPQVGAHDIASQFSNFVSILKGGMT